MILIGYMGAGKTTLGKALACLLGYEFCDLDWLIEAHEGKTVAQIFADQGEEAFRQIERQMLHEAISKPHTIIAVGGGTPCFYDNMDFMNQHATTVYLKASPETLRNHIRMGGAKRPLVEGKTDEQLLEYIKESLQQRERFYLKALHVMDVQTITLQEQIDSYAEQLANLISI